MGAKVVSAGKKGGLNGKAGMPPRKNAVNIRFELVTPSKALQEYHIAK